MDTDKNKLTQRRGGRRGTQRTSFDPATLRVLCVSAFCLHLENSCLCESLRCQFSVYFLGSSVNGLACTWNGLTIFTVPVNGRCAVFGSRHESEQTPPHPNSNVAAPQSEPLALASVSLDRKSVV